MRSEEFVYIFFDQPAELNIKYSFGFNQIVQERRTKNILYYPFFGSPQLDMMPPQIFINNNTYNVMPYSNVPGCLISIASRKANDYHFIDYPLAAFFKTFQIRRNIEYDMEVDFSRSYARFTDIQVVNTPFVIPFVFELHNF